MAKTASRSQWKGSISFGMVTIPVKMYGGSVSEDISFSQFHHSDYCNGPQKPWDKLDGILDDLHPFVEKMLAEHPEAVDSETGLKTFRGHWDVVHDAFIDELNELPQDLPAEEVALSARKVGRKEVCIRCEQEVGRDEIQRGYVVDKDNVIGMETSDFENLPVPTLKAIQVVEFVEAGAIDLQHLEKPYLLSPDEAGGKAFALLLRGMEAANRVAIAKLSIRSREHLVVIRPLGNAFLLHTLYYDDEIRNAPDAALPEISDQELDLAGQLIGALEGEWDVTRYSDAYRAALMNRIEAKVSGLPLEEEEMSEPEPTMDLTAGLLASITAARAEAA